MSKVLIAAVFLLFSCRTHQKIACREYDFYCWCKTDTNPLLSCWAAYPELMEKRFPGLTGLPKWARSGLRNTSLVEDGGPKPNMCGFVKGMWSMRLKFMRAGRLRNGASPATSATPPLNAGIGGKLSEPLVYRYAVWVSPLERTLAFKIRVGLAEHSCLLVCNAGIRSRNTGALWEWDRDWG